MYLRISCFSLIVDALLNDDTLFVVDFLCAADVAVFVLVMDNFFFLLHFRLLNILIEGRTHSNSNTLLKTVETKIIRRKGATSKVIIM